jgi:hypothetical protein
MDCSRRVWSPDYLYRLPRALSRAVLDVVDGPLYPREAPPPGLLQPRRWLSRQWTVRAREVTPVRQTPRLCRVRSLVVGGIESAETGVPAAGVVGGLDVGEDLHLQFVSDEPGRW